MQRHEMLIEAEELLTRIDDPNLRIYDTTILFFRQGSDLTAFEQYQQGHLPGAAFFDHDAFSDPTSKYMYMVLPQAELARQIGNIGISNESEVIFYTFDLLPCATRAWWLLRYAGHNNVRVLNGGLAAWQQAGGTIEPGTRQYAPTTYTGHFRPGMFVDKAEVQAALADGGSRVVNTNAMAHLLAGNANVAVYDGSMDEWSKEGLPITTG
jgi:thiosulfate/3-mercaptopyruvate sulfurtransferase